MGDLIFVALVVAFFVLAAGFIRLCDRVIGPDDDTLPGVIEPEVSSAPTSPNVDGDPSPRGEAGRVGAR